MHGREEYRTCRTKRSRPAFSPNRGFTMLLKIDPKLYVRPIENDGRRRPNRLRE
jgi:hypothetical protein